MTSNRSAEIKKYICQTFVKEDQNLLDAKKHAKDAGLPNISVPENVGKLLSMLTKLHKPERILEVGTLGGYSTLWLAKGAPDAKIITLEFDPKHAMIARENFQKAGKQNQILVIEGDAILTLTHFHETGEPPFDLIFLDANKEGYPLYLPLLLKLSKPGTLLLTDNLLPKENSINHPTQNDLEATGTYQYNDILASHPYIDTILVTTIVGEQGRIDALGVSLITHCGE